MAISPLSDFGAMQWVISDNVKPREAYRRSLRGLVSLKNFVEKMQQFTAIWEGSGHGQDETVTLPGVGSMAGWMQVTSHAFQERHCSSPSIIQYTPSAILMIFRVAGP